MKIETWSKLLGASQDDPKIKTTLAAAGVKTVPKREKDRFDSTFNLNGLGMWLEMTDEAYFKQLKNQDIGEGPLILTLVGAYIVRKNSSDVYQDLLPYNIQAQMTQSEVRAAMGPPAFTNPALPFDRWALEGLEFVARYTKADLKLAHVSLNLPKSP